MEPLVELIEVEVPRTGFQPAIDLPDNRKLPPSMQLVEPIILSSIISSIFFRTLSHDSSASSLSSFLSSFERNFGEASPAAASSTLSCIQVLNSKCPGVRSDSSLSLILAGSSSIDLVLLSFLS